MKLVGELSLKVVGWLVILEFALKRFWLLGVLIGSWLGYYAFLLLLEYPWQPFSVTASIILFAVGGWMIWIVGKSAES